MMTLNLAIRNIFRHRTRSLITISAIAFGATAVIFVGGFFEDILYKMQESYIKAHTGHLQIYRRGFFEKGNVQPFDFLIEEPEPLVSLISSVPGIRSVARRIQTAGLLSTGDNTVSCFAQGVEPRLEPATKLADVGAAGRDDALVGGSVIELGDSLTDAEPYQVVLGRGLAADIGAKRGDGLILVAHTVGGSINALDVTVRGVFFTSSKPFDDYALRLPLSTAQQLLQTEAAQALVVLLKRTDDTDQIRDQLVRLFAQRQLDLDIKTWYELNDEYAKAKAFLWRMFLILKLVVAIIVILSIYNTMNMAVLERITEIGTIMALGTTRRGVWRLFLYEGAALGLIGGAIGLLIGAGFTLMIQRIGIPMPPPPGATMSWHSTPVIVPSSMWFSFGLSIVTALISSFHPAYKASRLGIADALRHA